MVVGRLMTGGAIMFRQFNPTLIEVLDRPDVDAVCACSFNFARVSHFKFLDG
jgi:hypothetical protein